MAEELAPAIALMERRLADAERKVAEIRRTINVLCEEAGLPPRYPDADAPAAGGPPMQLRSDTFYGKKLTTAMREYLEMRRAQGLGPATPREIYDALRAGGYAFETKTDSVALVGLRAMLRKNTTVFHRLPGGGTYGLLSWYPNAKPAKPSQGEIEEEESEAAAEEKSAAA